MDAHSERDKLYHARIASVYDYITNEPRQYPNDLLFRPIDGLIRHTSTLLDLGCGTGQMFLRYRQSADRIIAVDHSAEMLAVAARKATSAGMTNVTFVEQDVEGYLDRNPSLHVGLVTCVGVLHHLDQGGLVSLMKKIFSVLQPGGQCVVAEPIYSRNVPALVSSRNARSILVKRLEECMPQDVLDPDEAPLEEATLLASARQAGFKIRKSSKGFELFQLSDRPSAWEKLNIRFIYWRYRARGDVVALLLEN